MNNILPEKLEFNVDGVVAETQLKSPEQRKQEMQELSAEIDQWLKNLQNEDK